LEQGTVLSSAIGSVQLEKSIHFIAALEMMGVLSRYWMDVLE
jgi:hypothetical protein